MRIRVDRDRCQGHALCAAAAPDLFLLDDLGYSALTELEVPPDREDDARRGARSCPERAITID